MDLAQTSLPHNLDPLIQEIGMRSFVISIGLKNLDGGLVCWMFRQSRFREFSI